MGLISSENHSCKIYCREMGIPSNAILSSTLSVLLLASFLWMGWAYCSSKTKCGILAKRSPQIIRSPSASSSISTRAWQHCNGRLLFRVFTLEEHGEVESSLVNKVNSKTQRLLDEAKRLREEADQLSNVVDSSANITKGTAGADDVPVGVTQQSGSPNKVETLNDRGDHQSSKELFAVPKPPSSPLAAAPASATDSVNNTDAGDRVLTQHGIMPLGLDDNLVDRSDDDSSPSALLQSRSRSSNKNGNSMTSTSKNPKIIEKEKKEKSSVLVERGELQRNKALSEKLSAGSKTYPSAGRTNGTFIDGRNRVLSKRSKSLLMDKSAYKKLWEKLAKIPEIEIVQLADRESDSDDGSHGDVNDDDDDDDDDDEEEEIRLLSGQLQRFQSKKKGKQPAEIFQILLPTKQLLKQYGLQHGESWEKIAMKLRSLRDRANESAKPGWLRWLYRSMGTTAAEDYADDPEDQLLYETAYAIEVSI